MNRLGISLDDLGLDPEDVDAKPVTSARPVAETNAQPDALTAGSPLAKVLFQVWSGRSVTIVKSPPGAGKSTLVVAVLDQLYRRAEMTLVLATPTRRGAIEMAERLGATLGKAPNGDCRVMLGMGLKPGEELSDNVAKNGTASTLARRVVVRTIASCAASAESPQCDLMVVDEAYQAVFADVALAAERATQVLLVGDPGQIGPVVQSDTAAWAAMEAGPHMRAPEVFGLDQDAVDVLLPCTYRVGQATVDAIAPLYEFPFASSRPDRFITRGGEQVPEILPTKVAAASEFDMDMLEQVAVQAVSFIGATVTEVTNGGPVSRALDASDIAVVVARATQESTVAAMLRRVGGHTEKITVGTADKLQGGQWHAVVALDPLCGADKVDEFRTGLGRLCVMASRHMTTMVWVHDGRWEETLPAAESLDPDDVARALSVRHALCSRPRTRTRAAA